MNELDTHELPKQLHIKVTQQHIERGIAVNCRECPIALAVRDAIPNIYNTVVSVSITIYSPDHHLLGVYTLTDEAMNFISEFDKGALVVEPFEFIAKLKEVIHHDYQRS